MRLLAILGSPRRGGNTDILAEEVIRGAAEAGLERETLALRSLKLHPCLGCGRCWETGRPCVMRDDMSVVYDAISRADFLLLATPVYWYGPTTLLKTIWDRLVPYNRPQGRPLLTGKSALVAVAYEEDGPEAAAPLLHAFELSFAYLGLPFVGRVVADGVGPAGAIREKPEFLRQAHDLGRSLGPL